MLPVMADFSSASSLLTLGTPLAGASGVSGSGASNGISFKSLLNEGDSETRMPEITAEPAGSFLPETQDTAASRIAADLKPLNGNEAQKEDNAKEAAGSGEESLKEADFYDLAADNDDLSQKLYSEELTSADYELYDPLSRAGEEISSEDLRRYAALPDNGSRDLPAAPSSVNIKEMFSETALNPEIISVLNQGNTAPAEESAVSAASHPVLLSSDYDDTALAASAAEKTSFAGHYSQESAEDNTEAAPALLREATVTAAAPGLTPELPEEMPFTLVTAFTAPAGNAAESLTPAASEALILDPASEAHSYRAMPYLMPEDKDLPVTGALSRDDVSGSAVTDAGESIAVISGAGAAEHPAIKTNEKTQEIAPDYRALPRVAAGNAAGHAVINAADWGSSAPEMVYVPEDDMIPVSAKESAVPENAAGMTAAKPETPVSAEVSGKEPVSGLSPELKLANPSEGSAMFSQAAVSDPAIAAARTRAIPENVRAIPENTAVMSPEKHDPAEPVITKIQEAVIPAVPEVPESIPETYESAVISPENLRSAAAVITNQSREASIPDSHESFSASPEKTHPEAVMTGLQPKAAAAAPAESVWETIRKDHGETYASAAASPENEAPAFVSPESGPDAASEARQLNTAASGNSLVSDADPSREDEAPVSGSAAASHDIRFSSLRAPAPGQLSGDKANSAPESSPRPDFSARNQSAGREAPSGKLAAKMTDNVRESSERAPDLRSLSKMTGLKSVTVRESAQPVIRAAGLGLEAAGVRENGAALDALNLLMAQKSVSTGIVSSAPVFFGEPEGLAAVSDSGFQDDAAGETLPDSSAMISASAETGGDEAGESGSFAGEQRSSGSREGLIPGGEPRGSAPAAGTGSFSSIFGKGLFGTGGSAQEADSAVLTGAVRLFEGQPRENAERLRDQVLRMAARNLRKVEIALTPERLGHLKIEVEMGDSGKARVHFAVQSSEAREVLSQSMDRLRDSLAEAGISLEGHTVDQESGGESRGRERAEREWENSLRRLARSGRHAEWQDSLKGALNTLSGASGIRKFW